MLHFVIAVKSFQKSWGTVLPKFYFDEAENFEVDGGSKI